MWVSMMMHPFFLNKEKTFFYCVFTIHSSSAVLGTGILRRKGINMEFENSERERGQEKVLNKCITKNRGKP